MVLKPPFFMPGECSSRLASFRGGGLIRVLTLIQPCACFISSPIDRKSKNRLQGKRRLIDASLRNPSGASNLFLAIDSDPPIFSFPASSSAPSPPPPLAPCSYSLSFHGCHSNHLSPRPESGGRRGNSWPRAAPNVVANNHPSVSPCGLLGIAFRL